jgi:hypothetical protein
MKIINHCKVGKEHKTVMARIRFNGWGVGIGFSLCKNPKLICWLPSLEARGGSFYLWRFGVCVGFGYNSNAI